MTAEKKKPIFVRQAQLLPESMTASSQSFFVSPAWFNPYLSYWPEGHCYGAFPELGLVLGKCQARSKLGRRYLALGFNESLAPVLESLTLEENGFLAQPVENFSHNFSAVMQTLTEQSEWDELRISAVNESQRQEIEYCADRHNLLCSVYSENMTYLVDFDQIQRAHSGSYLASVSSNTRQQLRRAKRLAESTWGALVIDEAKTIEQGIEWLSELGIFHQRRWATSNPLEGFNNQTFVRFYQDMIRELLPSRAVRIMRLCAGSRALAYLYLYEHKGRFSFVMSGVDYERTTHAKPGLLAHWLAIEKFQQEGGTIYDFLNGTNRYKESLSTYSSAMFSLRVRRRNFAFLLEEKLRIIKNKITNSR